MVAAPYKVAITLAPAKNLGDRKSIPVTASDVNAEFWVFPSGGSELQLAPFETVILDAVYTAAGTDTSQVEVFINGISTGVKLFNATNLGTVYNRQVQNSPLRVPAGALIKFKQLT